VPRPQDTNHNLNTYVLWQDSSSDIQVNWQDDNSGWKGPSTSPALKGADNGTSITCLTPSAWSPFLLQQNWDMCRCYFQVGRALREVSFNGTDWAIIGNVPIP
jgi:hypothetical protein